MDKLERLIGRIVLGGLLLLGLCTACSFLLALAGEGEFYIRHDPYPPQTQQGGGRELGAGQSYSGGNSSSNATAVVCNPGAKISLAQVTVPLSEVGAVWVAGSDGFSDEPWLGSNGYFSHYCQGKIRWQYEAGLSSSNGGTVTLLVEARHWSDSDAAIEFLRRGSDSGGAVFGWSPTTQTPVILIGNGK